MIKVLYEDNHLLGVEKPVNVPVNEDASCDEDLLSLSKEYIRVKYQKPGNVYLGLVHRLDRPVGGAVIFARTSKAASRLSDMIRTNRMKKTYLAVLDGVAEKQSDTLVDYLSKDHRTNMVTVTDEAHGKRSVLHYEVLAVKENKTLVKIHLETGRSHQIRVQFSSRGLPLYGDVKYNPAFSGKRSEGPALCAAGLSFIHPVTGKRMSFSIVPGHSIFRRFPASLYAEGEIRS